MSHIIITYVGTSHMSDNRHMSVAMQRLVDFISIIKQRYVTMQQYRSQQYVTMQQYCNALLAGFSVGQSIRNSPLLCNEWRNCEVTRVVFSGSVRKL
jgi:hypothetical protein